MKRKVLILTAVCMAATSVNAHAEEQAKKEEPVEMEQIGVTAKKDQLPVYSPAAVTESARLTTDVITKEEIEAIKPRDFYDLFSQAAGASTNYQGRKYMNFLSLRAGDSNNVGIIIDGFYMPSSQASTILAQFPMDAIESVRIVRDSTSLTVGPLMDLGTPLSSPNQGFIVITTKKGGRKEGGLAAEYGTLHSGEFQMYHGNKIGNFNYRLTGTISGSDGRDGWYTNQKAQSVLATGGYDGETLKVNSSLFYQNGMRNMEHSFTNTTNKAYWGYDPMEALWMAVSVSKLWTPNQVTSVSYSHGLLTEREIMKNTTVANNINTGSTSYMSLGDYADNAHLWHTATLGNNTLKTGIQAVFWHQPNGFAAWEGYERQEYLLGGYIQDEHKLLDGRLTVDGGVRVDDKYIKKGTDKYTPNTGSAKPYAYISNTWTEPSVGASVGAAYKLDPIHTLTVRLGYSYTATDEFMATVNSKKLDAEERYKYEAGVEGKYNTFFNPKLTMFYYDIKNYKKVVSTDTSGVYITNYYDVADIGRYGLELSAKGALPYGFSYDAKYSYAETTDGQVSSTMPRTAVSLLLSHQYGPIQSNMTIRYTGSFMNNGFTSPSGYVAVGGYTRMDANVSYNYKYDKMQGKITAYVQNMLDDRYQSTNGFSDQGATCGVRLEANF